MNAAILKLFQWITESAKTVIFLVFLLVIILASGIPKLQISNDFRVYLSQGNPQLRAFENFETNYVKSDTATFVITAKNGDIFTRDGLKLIADLTEDAWKIEHSIRVSSLSNYLYTRAYQDDIEINYLIENPAELSESELRNIRGIALSEKRLIKNLITDDGKLGLIVVNLSLPENEVNASIRTTEQVEKLRDRYRLAYPEFQIDNGGSTAFNTTLARAVTTGVSSEEYWTMEATLIQPCRVQEDCPMGCKLLLYRKKPNHVWLADGTV